MKTIIAVFLLLTGIWVNQAQTTEMADKVKYQAIGDVPVLTMNEIKETLGTHYKRVMSNYNVAAMPFVSVKIWQDRKPFESSYGEDAEFVQGYVIHKDWEVRFFNGRPQLGLSVVHEFTHLVTLALNPSFNNKPRWLWEATAIYESNRPPVQSIAHLNCFSHDSIPSLESLDQHPFNIYKTGYYLVEFIIEKWGRPSLIKLILSNGNIRESLDISIQQFEKQWLHFMKEKYGSKFKNIAKPDC